MPVGLRGDERFLASLVVTTTTFALLKIFPFFFTQCGANLHQTKEAASRSASVGSKEEKKNERAGVQTHGK